jgi:hypothetical protein
VTPSGVLRSTVSKASNPRHITASPIPPSNPAGMRSELAGHHAGQRHGHRPGREQHAARALMPR